MADERHAGGLAWCPHCYMRIINIDDHPVWRHEEACPFARFDVGDLSPEMVALTRRWSLWLGRVVDLLWSHGPR